jgi:hypothetical protein
MHMQEYLFAAAWPWPVPDALGRGCEGVLGGLIVAAVAALVFFMVRESCCWYWKINHAVTLLERIETAIRNQSRHTDQLLSESNQLLRHIAAGGGEAGRHAGALNGKPAANGAAARDD